MSHIRFLLDSAVLDSKTTEWNKVKRLEINFKTHYFQIYVKNSSDYLLELIREFSKISDFKK